MESEVTSLPAEPAIPLDVGADQSRTADGALP